MKKKSTPKSELKPTLVAFLLDRTGSMASCKDETIKGFNGYIKTLQKKGAKNMRFTLTQFDSIGIDIIHDAVPLEEVDKLTNETYEPRANTPLYDAIGKTIRATEKSSDKKYDVLFVTLTDGDENSSSDWNLNTIKELIKEKESTGWTFAHIGVGINGWGALQTLSSGTKSASNLARVARGKTGQGMAAVSCATVSYSHNEMKSAGVQNFYAGTNTAGMDEE